ncbi:hypothetical protein CA984_03640 [Streptosporangium minutum]|uniref:Uncharacterized protein n=1 Tax=Streptosporangium minutum TaxID=569862 RepID=A0A243RVV8_9ACTN|nr:hypothetical protein CA984_03640 [Streptosporangium minutum]
MFAPVDIIQGTSFPMPRLLFDAGADEARMWKTSAVSYGSGAWTIEVIWYAVNATSGVVRWEIAVAAVTPETDSQDIETKAFATAVTVDDTHLGTTSKRLHKATFTVSGANLDGVAADDDVRIRLRRIGSNVADTLANDAAVTEVRLSYSDS